MKLKIQALHDRVFVKRIDPENKTASGLIIPEDAQKKQLRGEVVATGPGLPKSDGSIAPLIVKEGDMVLFPESFGWEAVLQGEEITILREKDVLAILEP